MTSKTSVTPSRGRAPQAFTLVETSLSLSVFSIVAWGVLTLLSSSDRLFSTTLSVTEARIDATQILDRIQVELEQAGPATLRIDESSVSHDSITFQVPVIIDSTGVVFGAERFENQIRRTYSDHFIQYLLAPGNDGHYRLFRRILANDGTVVAEDILADDIDRADEEGKGFEIRRDEQLSPNLLVISLRKRLSTGNRQEFFRRQYITVHLRCG